MSRHKRNILHGVASFLVFFVLVAFVVTCCFFLFLSIMQREMALELTEAHLEFAAKLTFGNVLFLSLLFSMADLVRRKITVERYVDQILDATDAVTKGDFAVRIPEPRFRDTYGFHAIIRNFNRMAQELSGTETLKTDFVANVSHELKTPMAVMRNYAVLLQQPGLEEEKRTEYAAAVAEGSARLSELVANILRLNKLENQQIFPQTREYDLSEQLARCLLAFEDVWEKKHIGIEADIPDDVFIRSDPDLMELVWNNLLSNALKFTPEGGSVSLTLAVEEGNAVVTVKDSGCGMTAEQGKHIFEKFYQADHSHSTQGNGLGLALVKRVVDITGSSILVQSTPGHGSSFTVRTGGKM